LIVTVHYHGRTSADIAASIESSVTSGALAPGDALPTVRALAGQLQVSPATVAAAYRELRQRAVIETAGRAGTRIRARPALGAPRPGRMAYRLDLPAGARDLSGGGPDRQLLPALAAPLARLAEQPAWRTGHGYDTAGPLPDLLDHAAARLTADGVPADALAVTGGALDGIERTLTAQLAPGDRVAVEDPGWANLIDLLAALRLVPVPVPVDDDGPTEAGLRAALAAGVRAVLVTNRAQNPTGATLTGPRADRLRALLADRREVLVVEDDHAAELSETPLATLTGATDSWAFLRSVSKPYGPDLRLAVLAGDARTVGRLRGRQRVGAGWVSTVLQQLVLELWRDPQAGAQVAAARTEYRRRRDGLVAALADRGITAHGRSGINVWVPVADETVPLTRLRDAGWVVAPGAAFRLRSAPGLRVTISGVEVAEVGSLADAIAAAVADRPAGYGA
jgi:DNA-binding transcriptional MocR family regulator